MTFNNPLASLLSNLPRNLPDEDLVTTGDCGIVIKKDGTFRVFTSGVEGITEPSETWSDEQRQIYANGEVLMALAVAMATPQLMAVLKDATKGLIDMDALDAVRLH